VPVHNADMAAIFNKVANLLDIEDANQFRLRAYRNAARTIAGLPQRIVDLVPQESYGAARHYFTGSKAHNIAVRKIGVKKGLKITEYGISNGKADEKKVRALNWSACPILSRNCARIGVK